MSKPRLILLHGALGAASQLEPLRRALGQDVDVLELDGHGETPPTSSQFEMPRFVDQVRDHIQRTGNPASIFGYSMGGYVALLLAAETPALVSRVMTLATKFDWTPDGAMKETARLNPSKIREKVPAFAAQLEERHRGAGGWETVLAKTSAMMSGLGDTPLVNAEVLSRIAQPARLLIGSKDNVVSVDETAAAARHLVNGAHVVLEDVPHPIELVSVESLSRHVNEFLGS